MANTTPLHGVIAVRIRYGPQKSSEILDFFELIFIFIIKEV